MKKSINSDVLVIENNFKYITKNTLNQCFKNGEINHVDKVICGNGFSTAFLNTKPPKGKINILIAPNKAVVIDKEQSYKLQKLSKIKGLNRQKFFYAEGTSRNFNNCDVLVFVSDSFVRFKKQIKSIKDKIHWVLIDEAHSVEIQSSFRRSLVDFNNKVKKTIGENTALTTVTATPLLFSKCNIKILNEKIEPITIYASNDYVNAINRIKELNKKREKILLATNSNNVIYRLRDENDIIEADFNIGKGLMSSISEVGILKHNDRSNLKIISSRGFEGFDIYGEDYNVFFFEDRSNDSETFFISNLYQALNRCRDGFKRVDYIRVELSNARKEVIKNVDKNITRFIERKDISIEQKQATKYKEYHKFVIFEKNKDKPSFTLKKNDSFIKLHKEQLLYDNFFNNDVFDSFLNDRKITIERDFNVQRKLPEKRTRSKKISENLYNNREVIEKFNLFGIDYRLSVNDFDNNKQALRHLERYLRRKNYNGLYEVNKREELAIELLSDVGLYSKTLINIIAINEAYHKKKYSARKSKERNDNFKKLADSSLRKLILMFVNEKPSVPKKIVGYRDYNLLTSVSTDVIKYVGGLFGFEVIEYDIRNCFPRILYALNGLQLPDEFYGINKSNKVSINIFLNDFMLNTKMKTPAKIQKKRSLEKFNALGFDEKVVDFLMKNFFNAKFRGNLFNYLSFYEEKIIEKLQYNTLSKNDISNIRRHDSVLLFVEFENNKKYDINSVLNDVVNFEFLGQKNWFVNKEDAEYFLTTIYDESMEYY